jgi:hypothetical protein
VPEELIMEIPRYPAGRPLDINDKPLLDDIFDRLQPKVSELAFANLYLFRTAHDYRLATVGDALVVLGKGYGGEEYFLPPLTGDIAGALAVLFGDGLTLYGADEAFAQSYLREEHFDVSEDRDNFDYLYLRAELAELPGNRYHKKKNRINYFASRHTFAVERYSDRYLAGSLALLDEWQRVHAGLESRSLALETEAAREALKMTSELGLQGVVVLVEGEVRACVLGEKLNATTSVCHFEKADPFLEGLYQLVDREFNRLLFTDCTWVNREQDLGEPNLRDSKLSYHPVELVKKFRARYKNTMK